MADTYTGECRICGEETDLIMGICQECVLTRDIELDADSNQPTMTDEQQCQHPNAQPRDVENDNGGTETVMWCDNCGPV